MNTSEDSQSIELAIDRAADEAARRHTLADRPPEPAPVWAHLADTERWLARARELFADPEAQAAKAAEWFLDNEYLVGRAIRQIEKDLPAGFYRQLPVLANEGEGDSPRILAVARELLDASHLQLSPWTVTRFVDAYQRRASLTTAELWALPTALRLACLEVLVAALQRILPGLEAPFEVDRAPVSGLEDTECIARAIGDLRVITSISWNDFFERTSAVEAILRRDPLGIYARLDFETADRYRRIVESLARSTPHSEVEVAERVVAFAQRHAHGDPRCGHVGYWLIDAGREDFERSLGFRPPARLRFERFSMRHRMGLYVGAVLGVTAAALVLPAFYLFELGATPATWLMALAVMLIPASVLGVTTVNWLLTQWVAPDVLPKLDLANGIPPEYRTAVVVPCLVSSPLEVEELLETLEAHHLGNPAANVEFVLLSDFADAPCEEMEQDESILSALRAGTARLNERYAGSGRAPFHVLHRPRTFNACEDCWMGRERKRGKLEDFNRLILGDPGSVFLLDAQQEPWFRGIRFVITLDADTILPRGSVQRLVGIMAHPLNRARFDDATGRVVAGYTVVQPRVEIEPATENRSRFTRLFAGDTAIDIYSRAVSDVYQDFLGSGIYVGKGIYDVAAFARSLEGRIPENALVSHDLFEGIHGRAGLATDVVLYESFPNRYLEYARRMHRWIRGDWQLLPWLGRRVPGAGDTPLRSRLSTADRWKILDNLRRSLLAPSIVVMLAAGWLWLPGSTWLWTMLGILAPAGHLFTDLVTGFARGRRRSAVRSALQRFYDHAGRWVLLVVFLPHEAWIAGDAIVRTLFRLYVTRRGLLEWTSAAHTARELDFASGRWVEWRTMRAGPIVAVGLGAALYWVRPGALPSAAILLIAWLISPEIAFRLGVAHEKEEPPLSESERLLLRKIARRTWLYFETFAGPIDQWLPPDNFQEDPGAVVAHRTSPTNIGMMLLSTLTARDLGYVSADEFASRLANVFDTVKRMERYRGHLLNWYDTCSLDPLEPRYVSTVDSGNLALSLVALKEGCRELADRPPIGPERWDGLVDMLALLEEDLERLDDRRRREKLRGMLRTMESHAMGTRDEVSRWTETLEAFEQGEGRAFEEELRVALNDAKTGLELSVLRDIRIWLDRVHHHVREMRREIGVYAPWSGCWESAPPPLQGLAHELADWLPPGLPLGEARERIEKARDRLDTVELGVHGADVDGWCERVGRALDEGRAARERLCADLLARAEDAESTTLSMDFTWLYDDQTRLFHIGYNVSAEQVDSHEYDLLASEARIASIVAIAKGDVPIEHWFHLGRAVTLAGDRLCLVSWAGSMFEYLMPSLLLKSESGTLLAQSEGAAVEAQKRFARTRDLPWGVSESGFASLDASQNYRYRAFGVPALGLRRDLAEDSVVAPYATILALHCDRRGAIENLQRLVSFGMVGEYGLFEAADFTPERVPEGRDFSLVYSYMAHHQGMILAALGNALCGRALIRRVHADPRLRSVELLLHERVPTERPPESLARVEQAEVRPTMSVDLPPPWSPTGPPGTALHLLGNGRLSSAITDTGSGRLRWQGIDLTRWAPDPTSDNQGLLFYVKDEETGDQWPAVPWATERRRPNRLVRFHPHMAEFHRVERGIGLGMEVAVVPGDDVEIRRFSVINETERPRSLTITSYAEIALGETRDDARHPAFSKLFVRSEWLESRNGLLFSRRPRTPDERPPVVLHRLIADSPGIELIGYESDRRAFLGRGRDARNPEGRVRSSPESSVGYVLDAIASLCVRVDLEPNQSVRLAFVTLVAGSRGSILEIAERYQTPSALDWVIADAASDVSRRLRQIGIEGGQLPMLGRLASRIEFPLPGSRCSPDLLRENQLGQPRLWGMGISGDLPILLLRTLDSDGTGTLHDLVVGHRLWRENGLDVDLVILREASSSYVEPIGEKLLALLQELGVREQLGRKGGIHFLVADQMTEQERRFLQVAARVILDTRRGSLARQLAVDESTRATPPLFLPEQWGRPRPPTRPLERPNDLEFDNGFGGFSPDGRDYVIFLEPGRSTPAPWSNVLANERFGCIVTESGGGFSWAGNSGEHRLSPWTNDPVSDASGEVLYLRDEETGVVWTPTPAPVGAGIAYEIRHGAARTQWRSNAEGLAQTLRVFVPPDEPLKLIHLRLHNDWDRPRRITATYYVEWVLGVSRRETAPYLVPDYDPTEHVLLVRNPWAPEFADRTAFLSSSARAHGVTVDRGEFLGRGGSLRSPAALARWGLSNRVEPGTDPCGALQVHLELGPGEDCEVHFVLGEGDDRAHALDLVRRWREPEMIGPALASSEAFWDDLLDRVEVRTPDRAMDLMLNRRLLHQAVASRIFARSGFYQSGGAIGFRDQLQDSLALVHAAPERTRSQILEAAAHQFEEGDVLHWWHPPTGRGVRTRCSDDLLWLPFATAHYVEATGDASILDETVPFLRGDPLSAEEAERYAVFEADAEGGSIFEHCARALERGVTSGPHGLPRIGTGDWNDGMNRIGASGVGESIWLGWFAIAVIRGFAKLCDRRGEAPLADRWRRRMSELSLAVEESGWDGRWYRRAIDDDGQLWGSAESEECRIDSIAQSWSALSGAGRESRVRQALLSAETRLVRADDGLIELLWPPFDRTLRDPGYIKAYPPGIRENGGQYTHAAAWLGWAFVELGDPERAMRVFRLLDPIAHARDVAMAERYRVEPYALAADVASVPPYVGRGGWTWYTGAAAWTWRLGVEGILGIRRENGGVRVEPCIPPEWGHAEVRYRGPNGLLVISIEDPDRVGQGVVHRELDGEPLQDPVVMLPRDGGEHALVVRLGR